MVTNLASSPWGAAISFWAQTDRHFKQGQTALRVKDMQALFQWVLGETQSPAWVFVKNKPLCRSALHIVGAVHMAGSRAHFTGVW